jgi:non-homologous end joining protein Ku
MITFTLITIAIAAVLFYLFRTKKIEDKNNNYIPDAIEDKIEDAKEVVKEIKSRVEQVKAEAADVVEAVKEVAKQSGDVVQAAKGNKRKGKKPTKK